MTERDSIGQSGVEIVGALAREVKTTGAEAWRALEELSLLAMAGYENAQEAVDAIDKMVESGRLILPEHDGSDEEWKIGCSRLPVVGTILDLLKIGEVPQEAWSEADQERLREGEKPQDYPEHPNV